MANQSIGDKIAEKLVGGVNAVKDFAKGGYKDAGKNLGETCKTVGKKVSEGAKKAADFTVEKVFQREGESLEETKARIKRGEFGSEPKAEATEETVEEIVEEIVIEGSDEEVVVEEVEK